MTAFQSVMAAVLFLWTSAPIYSQEPLAVKPSETSQVASQRLTIDRIFDSPDFKEERPGLWIWSRKTPSYFTLETAADGQPGKDLVRVDTLSGVKQIVVSAKSFIPPGRKDPLAIDGIEFSADESKLLIFTNSQRVWRRNTRGDYWVLDVTSGQLRQLGGDARPASMMFAKFSPDAQRVAFVRENNLHVQQLDSLRIDAVTRDGSANIINGTSDWVNEEELDIRDGYRWHPDGHSIAYWQFNTEGVSEFTMIDNTSDKYSRPIRFAYPKVGEKNSAARVGVAELASGSTRWLNVPGDPREHYIARMEWLPTGNSLILQQFNRLQNINRVFIADASTGHVRQALVEAEETWLENDNPIRWLLPGRDYLWISERDGWRHAYRAVIPQASDTAPEAVDQSSVTTPLTCLTPGPFDIIQVDAVDTERGWIYFSAAPENPTQRYLYRLPISGGTAERLTPDNQPGSHTYDISPSGDYAVHTYSTLLTPPQIELVSLPEHRTIREIASNRALRQSLSQMELPNAEFFRVAVGHDQPLDAWCLKPPGFNESASYPLLIYVYGEPHGQTVRDAWQGPRGLWHLMMAQQGYLVASVDNRGTMSPRGRAWRKCVHRQIGMLASQEQAQATEALLQRWPCVDRQRVGVWGWSGGGSMSLNAIFRYPDLFHVAVAVASVPNQLLYDTIYQERYMGLPEDNAEGYRLGSPLTHAKNLKGDLMIIHGTGDDNCHYQGTELLINELITHNKQFSVMPYPGRSHSISEGNNTVRHFYATIAKYFDTHLKQRPAD